MSVIERAVGDSFNWELYTIVTRIQGLFLVDFPGGKDGLGNIFRRCLYFHHPSLGSPPLPLSLLRLAACWILALLFHKRIIRNSSHLKLGFEVSHATVAFDAVAMSA